MPALAAPTAPAGPVTSAQHSSGVRRAGTAMTVLAGDRSLETMLIGG